MEKIGGSFRLSAGDLVGYLNCHHLTALDRAVAEGTRAKPKAWDPLLEILRERGWIHEQNYVDHLTNAGLKVVRIDGVDVSDAAVGETLAAMKDGAEVIVQGALAHDGWAGRADILRKVETTSVLGPWSYEAIDTKLARETKAGTVLQLCLYSDLLNAMQGAAPEWMHVIVPWSDFEPQCYRFADYGAYYRQVKNAFAASLAAEDPGQTYPDPVPHCDICRWREACDKRRRDDDHLCLVAGISKLQMGELKVQGIATVQDLAAMPLPLAWKPDRGSPEALIRVREQARIQCEARSSGARKFEVLPVEHGFGLTRLPAPSKGDIFLDLEGDPFVGEHGLEYLFGYLFVGEHGEIAYRGEWAFKEAPDRLRAAGGHSLPSRIVSQSDLKPHGRRVPTLLVAG
ncbi:TM0106 family RecB-like putative nuclease [Pseudaminobacter arsenicus]|uniref:TM0106 family RecB-like putative nuclease n=1 Tax=Borborobacter arsenicus TaxID=1851146 RepID=A0A432UZ70_9HYPH|nr:TM0106 family RecB-like putative nuclease [Pseudaminobacter arsenicus]RUM95226.1 TM0106 family RecB-like putative nuclease [Pseudaminobacter arsenicus]